MHTGLNVKLCILSRNGNKTYILSQNWV